MAAQSSQQEHKQAMNQSESDLESISSVGSPMWPVRICSCMPMSARVLIPPNLQVIHDWTHAALVLSLGSAFALLFSELTTVFLQRSCSPSGCFRDILIFAATLPCFNFIFRTLNTYDENIRVREEAIMQKKRELSDSYESLVASIDDLLGKAAESSATMAERSFESKRRDFQRFLERAERNYSQVADSPDQAAALLKNFKSFVQCWLVVFSECSIDPIHNPKRVVTPEELAQCDSIGAVASLTLDRLKQTEVRFISSQRDMDAQDLHGFRAEARRLTTTARAPDVLMLQRPSQQSSTATMEIELTASSSWAMNKGASRDPENNSVPSREPSSHTGSEDGARENRRCSQCSWLQCGTGYPCGMLREAGNGFPAVLSCKCMRVVLLSRDHTTLVTGLFASAAALLLMVFYLENELISFCMAAVYLICLCVFLVQFEQIDVIKRLEREVSELQAKSDSIMERRERMVKFWNDMQDLTDIWVHRTVPRLDLLKELQSLLDVTEPEDVLPVLAGANRSLEALERALPELPCWLSEGGLSEGKKRAFAEKILKLCQEESIPKIVHALNGMIEEGIPRPSISVPVAALLTEGA